MQIEDMYLSVLNNICDGVYFVDTNRKILFWNHGAEEITGFTADEMLGKHCNETRLNHIDEQGHPLCAIGCPLFDTIVDGERRKATVYVCHKKGYRIPILTDIMPIYKDNKTIGAIEIFTQKSSIVYDDDLVSHLSDIAMHDTLTTLPNRRYMESYLEYKMNEYKRFGKKFAVLFADIDHFKDFNDRYGHDIGDNILKNISQSLKKCIKNDSLIGRLGGEEFIGVYTINYPDDLTAIGEQFRQLVANTDILRGKELLKVTISVGVTTAKENDTCESIINRADELMYQSKKNGRNCVTTD